MDIELLNEREASKVLGISPGTLQAMRMKNWKGSGKPVPWIRVGGSVRYSTEDLKNYINQNRFRSEPKEQEPQDQI